MHTIGKLRLMTLVVTLALVLSPQGVDGTGPKLACAGIGDDCVPELGSMCEHDGQITIDFAAKL